MRFLLLTVILCLSMGCASSNREGRPKGPEELNTFTVETLPGVSDEYLISVGDRLDIVFFFNQELTEESILVRSDGRITLPYIGDLMAAGITPMKLDSTLTTSFSEIIREPNISVIVREPAESIVYVLGEVKKPGAFPMEGQMSILHAVSQAGGLDIGAKATSVLVIRREGLSKVVGAEVDLRRILKGRDFQGDFLLKNYDIVYVPQTKIKSMGEFMTLLMDVIEDPLNLVIRGWQVKVLQENNTRVIQ